MPPKPTKVIPTPTPAPTPAKATNKALTNAIDAALQDKAPSPLVHIIPGDDGRPVYQSVVKLKGPTTVDVKRNLLRIQHDADPIGFLAAMMNGAAVPVTTVGKDGAITTEYEQATTKDRIKIAVFLANKVLPSLSIQKHVMDDDKPKDEANLSVKPGQGMTFSQMVAKASHNGGVMEPPMIDITPEEPRDGNDE